MTANLQATVDSQPDTGDQRGTEPESRNVTADSERPGIQCDAVLELLGDEYACEIMRALSTGPMAARDLLEQCDMSRPTVYRRLDRLAAAGVVDSRTASDGDGTDKQEYLLRVSGIQFRISDSGINSAVGPCTADD